MPLPFFHRRLLSPFSRWVWVMVFLWGTLFFFEACGDQPQRPDVSQVKLDLQVERFEQGFFTLDTAHLPQALTALEKKHPGFTQDFLYNILGTSPQEVERDVPRFIQLYLPVKKQADSLVQNWSAAAQSVKEGLKYFHHYVPDHVLPKRLISFVGPMNGYGAVITTDAIGIGLQLYLGKDHPLYATAEAQTLFPAYLSRRFEPNMIPVNALRTVIDDAFPAKTTGLPLVVQMVEAGKRAWLLAAVLPQAPDSLLTGYTTAQLEHVQANEKGIWSYFLQNDLLYQNDALLVRDYVGEAPGTAALGPSAPGNVGTWLGRQIVDKWMRKNKATVKQLMAKDPQALYTESKYKP